MKFLLIFMILGSILFCLFSLTSFLPREEVKLSFGPREVRITHGEVGIIIPGKQCIIREVAGE